MSANVKPHTPERVLLVLLAICLWPSVAHAYIDPGAGSLLYQTSLAVFLGLAVVFRRAWVKVGTVLVGLFKAKKPL